MKKIYLILLITYSFFSHAQTEEMEYSRMIESEMKAAAAVQNFQANPNTENYDITYHEINVNVDPAVYFINGEVTTTFTALEDMTTITFDMANELTASLVTINSTSVGFVQNGNNEIVITLPSTLLANNSQTVAITYSGAPPVSGFSAFAAETHNGTPVMWTLSEPYGARDWWPCKQDLNDKINTFDFYITAPSQYIGVANGLEQSAIDNGNGTKTTHFHHSYPIPAYLIAFAVTNYTIFNQQGGLGTTESPYFPIVNYIYPETSASTQSSLAVTPNIINLFEDILGPYPFRNEKYGHAEFGWSGGMEHTTVSFMGGWSRSLIAHEMAHQWFGNKVTCGTWKDIWLNEGLTEYMSGLVVENFDGPSNFVSWKAGKSNNITLQSGGNLYLTDAQIQNIGTIFSGRITYNKGAMVTNMIRYVMGDTHFFQALQNYLNDPTLAYNYAVTTDFKSHIEAVSGIDFTEFFNDWIYNQGYPTYDITVQNWGAGQAKITVNQTQSHASVSYFEMPLLIRLNDGSGTTHDVTINNTTNAQEFVVNVPFVVASAEFDPNKDIISRNNAITLSNATFDIDETISIYPNPSSDTFHVMIPSTLQLKTVQFYNSLGQLIMTQNQKDFSVSNLASGAYVVTIETNEGQIHKNFIKK